MKKNLLKLKNLKMQKMKGMQKGVKNVQHSKKKENMPQGWKSICDVETQSLDDARRQYEEMTARQKKRCDERMEQWDKERAVLEAIVEKGPCCEGGCVEELVYKDYLLQSQATYYKKHLKKVCGVRRPPDPDEKELVNFMKEIEEEEEEVF